MTAKTVEADETVTAQNSSGRDRDSQKTVEADETVTAKKQPTTVEAEETVTAKNSMEADETPS